MSHAKHRAPRRPLPTTTIAAAGPLALAALGLVAGPSAQAMTPAADASATSATSTTAGTSGASSAAKVGGTYTVRGGDTLASIARSQGVPGGWQALAAANRATVADPGAIRPGQRLVIPGGSSGGSAGSGTSSGSGSTGSGSGSTGSGTSGSGTSGSGSTGSGSTSGSSLVAFAKTFTGVPYRWGGTSRSGVDCSGLTSLVLRNAGYSPPRTAATQYGWARKISASEARPGDLVFGYFSGGRPGHVGIYLGGGQMIDAPRPGKVVGVHRVSADSRYGRPPS